MAGDLPEGRIVDVHVEDAHVNLLWRMAGIRRRINTTLIIEKISA
jgi:hypothetical protein